MIVNISYVLDNDFTVYICDKNIFGMYNIVDESLFNENYNITEIIKQLEACCNK